TWNRIEGGHKIEPLVNQLLNDFDFKDPSKSINLLTTIYKQIDLLPESIWKTRKLNEVKNLIKDCAGLFLDITTNDAYVTSNKTTEIKIEVVNRSNQLITINEIVINNTTKKINQSLKNQEVLYDYLTVNFTNNDLSNFNFIDDFSDFKTQFDIPFKNKIGLTINDVSLEYDLPIQYKYKDVVTGEIYKPFHIIPAASIQFSKNVYINNNTNSKSSVILSNYTNDEISGIIEVYRNNNNKPVYTQKAILVANEKNKEIELNTVLSNGNYHVKFFAENQHFENQIKWIDYPHIPLNYHLKEASTQILS